MAMSHRPFSLFFAGKLRIAKYKQRRHKNLSESECMELIASASKRGKNVSQFIWNCYSFSLLDFWLVEKVARGFSACHKCQRRYSPTCHLTGRVVYQTVIKAGQSPYVMQGNWTAVKSGQWIAVWQQGKWTVINLTNHRTASRSMNVAKQKNKTKQKRTNEQKNTRLVKIGIFQHRDFLNKKAWKNSGNKVASFVAFQYTAKTNWKTIWFYLV